MDLKSFIPVFNWLPGYTGKNFRADLIAGITVCVVLIPQGMAYAMLAGLPPVYGLYAGIVPLFLYAFLGSSRQLSVGPVALVSLLILSGVSAFAETGTDLFITLAIATALIAGLIQILLGVFKLGFLINFLSHPVISGFTSAAALIIGLSQLKNILGIDIPRSNQIQYIFKEAFIHITESNLLTIIIGIGGIILILIFKRISRNIPAALIAVFVGTLLVWGFNLQDKGVDIVGEVPKGLPSFSWPELTLERIGQLLPLAMTICLISFIESLAIAKTIQARHKDYEVSPNQELIALGLTKIGGSFFQSYPTTGSFTRSAINDEAGARTGVSSIITAILVAITLMFFTPIFYYLPNAILASIIVAAVIYLIDVKEAVHLWHTDRRDFFTLLTTFIITVTFGIQEGVLAGVVLSLALMIYHNAKPHIGILGQIPNSVYYRNMDRFPEAIDREDMLIVRLDAQLYFGNADFFKEHVLQLIEEKNDHLKIVILNAESIHDIDSSGIKILKDMLSIMEEKGIKFYISGVIGPVRDKMYRNGLIDEIGVENHFMRIHDAVQHYTNDKTDEEHRWTEEVAQTNEIKKKS